MVTYQQAMTTCLNNVLDTQKSELLKVVYRAYEKFQLAGNELAMVLDEIDKLSIMRAESGAVG